MLLRKFGFVAVALMLASCSQSGGVPPTIGPNSTHEVTLGAASVSHAGRWRFFQVSTTGTGLASDEHNRIWYFSSNTSISNITPSGHVTTYAIPLAGTDPVFGNDGNIWFVAGSKIGRFLPTGSTKYFDVTGSPTGFITPGFNNDVWFTARNPNSVIEHMTSNGAVTTYPLQPTAPNPCPPFTCTIAFQITRGPDGDIWFDAFDETVILGGTVGKINPATGAISLSPQGSFFITSLTVGPDKRMWALGAGPVGSGFPQCNGVNGFLFATNTNFVTAEYPVPCQYANGGLIVGARDALFAALNNANPLPQGFAILRVATNGQITATYSPPSQIPCCPNSLVTSGNNDDIWFSVSGGIGELNPRG